MKNSLFLLALAGTLMSSVVSKAQTTVSGNLTANTVWTLSSSPYQIVGDVGVPSGITLTVEPGIQVQFNDACTIQVQGQLLAIGTETNKIVFDAGSLSSGIMILFQKTNLSNSKISNVNFNGNINAVQLAQKSEDLNESSKNSGVLLIDSCTFYHSSVQANGYWTTASVSISNSQFDHCTIKGVYPESEPITVRNSSIVNSVIWSDSYNHGITIDRSIVQNSEFKLGCCGANFTISNSTVVNSTLVAPAYSEGVGGPVRLSNSLILDTPINLPSAQFAITRCILVYFDTSSSQASEGGSALQGAIFGNGTIANSTFVGNRSNAALEANDIARFYRSSIDISKSIFIGASTALKLSKVDSVTIHKTSFVNSSGYNIENLTSKDITATENYWGTKDAAQVASRILDGHDNLNYGMVNVEPFLTVPDADAPISPPENASKWVSSGLMRLSWWANQETDVAGYKVHYGNFTGYSFSNVVDVGRVTIAVLPGVSMEDTIAVTAYDSQANGVDDQVEGHESWYAISTVAAVPVPPVLAAPANGLGACSASVTLTWNAAETAAAYQVQVATDSLFNNVVVDDSTVTAASRQMDSLANNTTYYWRVRSANARGTSGYSSVWRFKTVLSEPRLASPCDNALRQPVQVTLKVNSVPGAVGYHWQVWSNSLFSPVVVDDSTTGACDTARTVLFSAKIKYFWRVSAFDSSGEGAFSPTQCFTTTAPVPLAVYPIGTTGEPRRATFKWNHCVEAAGYHLQVATDSTIDSSGGFQVDNVVFDTTLSDTSMRLWTPLEASMAYYWHVSAKEADGESAYSKLEEFRTGTGVDAVDGRAGVPTEYSLSQNFPNPFNPTTVILYDLPRKSHVSLAVYDLLGRTVATLVNEAKPAGRYHVIVDAGSWPSGVYFYRLSTRSLSGPEGTYTSTKKLLLLK